MRATAFLLSLSLLAACGADGAPVPPAQSASQQGVSVTGQVKVGVVGN